MSFADIGKKARDLQSKEFLDLKDDKYSRSAFEVRTKSLAGTGFAFVANRKSAATDAAYDASLSVKKSCSATGIDSEFTFTQKTVKYSGSSKDKLAEGVKVGVSVEGAIQEADATKPKLGAGIDVDYAANGNTVNVKAGKALKDGKNFLELSVAHSHERALLGLNVKLSPAEGEQLLNEVSVGAEQQTADANVSLVGTYTKKDDSFKASVGVFHQYSAASQFAAIAVVPVRPTASAADSSLTAVVSHKLAADESIRARVQFGGDFSRHAGLVYSTRVGAHTTVTASTDARLDELLSKGISNDAVKFGFKVSLNAE